MHLLFCLFCRVMLLESMSNFLSFKCHVQAESGVYSLLVIIRQVQSNVHTQIQMYYMYSNRDSLVSTNKININAKLSMYVKGYPNSLCDREWY